MNIYITVDLEGISGITSPEQMTPQGMYYNEGRRYMTWDVNACIEGCLQGGARKIYVRDVHYRGKNLIWEELSPHAEYIIGAVGEKRMPGIEECDGVILLGYHAMAGTAGGILEHTWSSAGWQNFWLNGRLTGEIGIEAAIAGEYDKPVIMVSGDDKTCAEALDFLPGVVTAQVKAGMQLNGGRLLSREAAHKLIREKAAEAVQKCREIQSYKVESPVTMRLELVEQQQVPLQVTRPYVRVIDGRTFELTASSVEEGLCRI